MKLVPDHNRTTFVARNFLQVAAVHVGALAVAPFLFTWKAFAFAFLTTMVFGYAMGIFHHMLLTHRSFTPVKWVENLGSLLGTLTWRGPFAGPVQYVAMHRVHHAHSDTELDPHSPTRGIFHAWLGWFWRMPRGFTRPELYEFYARDLAADPWHRFLDRNVHLLQLVWGVLCFVGGAVEPMLVGGAFDPVNGVRYLVFGVFVRALLTFYLINAVDVINHTVGYRAYETRDQSTNSFLMAFIHLGGAISWHNNHHAHPGYFTVRRNWWEFDAHHQFLRLLSVFGLVSDIKVLDEVGSRTKTPAEA